MQGKSEPGLPAFEEDRFGTRLSQSAISANKRTMARVEGDVLIRTFNVERSVENKVIIAKDLSIKGLMADETISAMACAPDGRSVAARIDVRPDRFSRRRASGELDEPISTKALIRLYHVDRATALWERDAGAPNCRALVFSPNGHSLAMIGGAGDAITLLETATGKLRAAFKTAGVALTFSADGVFVGVGTQDGGVRVLDVRDGKEIASFQGHNGRVTSLAFTGDAGRLLSSNADGTILVWDVTRQTTKALPRSALSAGQAKERWADLLGPETDQAYQAVVELANSPAQAIVLLKEQLKPDKPMEEAQIDKLITELDGDTFDGRQKALTDLGRTGERFRDIFQDALDNDPAPEARKNLEQLLAWLEPGNPMPEILRDVRAIEVLETIGTPEARSLLETLSKGARGSPLTREAAAALKRMPK
jgi:hypothetical protein